MSNVSVVGKPCFNMFQIEIRFLVKIKARNFDLINIIYSFLNHTRSIP